MMLNFHQLYSFLFIFVEFVEIFCLYFFECIDFTSAKMNSFIDFSIFFTRTQNFQSFEISFLEHQQSCKYNDNRNKYKQFYLLNYQQFLYQLLLILSILSIINLITIKAIELEDGYFQKRKLPQLCKAQTIQQLGKLVRELQSQAQKTNNQKKKQVQNQRRMHHSCNEIKKSYRYRKSRPFNNKTKQGQFFEKSPPQVPYLFIPKYKNETFIMPDKVFEKGDAGKRLFIKMKDTSIYSFKDPENQRMTKFLHRQQKNKVISGRKMEELNRILNQADGRQKAKKATEHLKTRKIFNPTRMTSDQFSMVEPMMQPKQEDTFQKKKVTLNKTFGPNLWLPASRGDKLYETSSSFAYKTQGLKRAASHRA